MVSLRNFVMEDAELLQNYKYQNMPLEDIQNLIIRWNTGNFHGNYFIMLAVVVQGHLVGMVSLYQFTEHVVAMRPEIFPIYRRQGFAKSAMLNLMEMARNMGYEVISQQIRAGNVAGIALHKSLGFETDGYLYSEKGDNKLLVYLKAL